MDRRNFLAASCVFGTAPLSALAAAAPQAGGRQWIELRRYRLLTGPRQNAVGQFLRDAGIAALNRHGIGPVGVMRPMYGPNEPSLYVLLPHPSLESVVTLNDRLAEDDEFLQAAADYVDAPFDQPAYARIDRTLLLAFEGMPQVEVPPQKKEGKPRIFELRRYESHSERAAKKKIEMFHQGGELAIFRKTGLRPVFFGEAVIGPQLPNLHYMLCFDDMTARDAAWKNFSGDPDWKALRSREEYANTVSNIADYILRPLPYSQI